MDFHAWNGERSLKLDGTIFERLDYNPFDLGKGIVGFYLKGERVLPVVDLQERLKLKRTGKRIYVVSKSVVFIFEYESIKREAGNGIDISEIEREVLRELRVDGGNG